MKRIIVRSAIVLVSLIVVIFVGAFGTVNVRWKRTFADVPMPAIKASTDPAIIEQGAYLAYGPAHCAYCHTDPKNWPRLDAGERVPLSGGFKFPVPFGDVYTRNITPDKETGIGNRTDGELARTIRYNVHADGRALLPFMEFQQLSDEDLTAVISFLRTQQPVRNEIPEVKPNTLGKALYSFVFKPVLPATEPRKTSPTGLSVERGEYLANAVGNCAGCHSERSMTDGSYLGPKFGGGGKFDNEKDAKYVFVTPNLTPDPTTGHITKWTEDDFVARFRAGEKIPGTPMPWKAFGRMGDDDLRSLYRYLRSLPPVQKDNGDIMQLKKPEKSAS